jgi:hypothetical protein
MKDIWIDHKLHIPYTLVNSKQIEERILDTNAGKQTILSCQRCLINAGVEKLNKI